MMHARMRHCVYSKVRALVGSWVPAASRWAPRGPAVGKGAWA